MSSNASNGDDRQPLKTDVVIPGENVVVDHWVVSSGSAVRAKDTIAYVRKRGDGANETSVVPTVVAPKHKRPTRRKKFKKTDSKPQASNGSTTSTTTTTKSSAMSLKDLLAAKNKTKTESSATTTKPAEKDTVMEAKTEETKSTTPASTTSSKAKQLMPIHAPASGILRIHSAQSSDNPQRRLVIGVVEECLHPTYVDGMCVVCGAPKPKETKDSQTTNNSGSKTLKVTVSGGVTMTVSQRESESMALLDSDRLFKQKRLSLVLDLDHTLVHATADARARQYLNPSHPVGVAAGDVRMISLPMFEGADNKQKDPRHKHMRSQHFVKLRPFVKEFLEGVRHTYEVSVYTAGTRQYAEEIAMVLCRKLAGANMDYDDLEQLRQTVQTAEKEYERTLETEKKRAAESTDEKMAEDAPPRKKKKVSFQMSEAADVKNADNHDIMTKEKLSTLQAELLAAEALESKAKTLRQSVFGSRIISRTDVGDLGRDVKSLKRVFPCGGIMAAVVDDREDVWANAKDNSKGTIKGEPPDNLLLVRPYHWQPFVGFADVNNVAGADLSGSGPAKQDKQLLYTKDILEKLHTRYYKQSAEGNRQTVPDTLKEMRKEVLMGSHIVLSGLVPLHKQGINGAIARPHFVRYAQNLGAKTQDKVDYRVTHVVAAKDGTDKCLSARKMPGCRLVKSAWLMECFWSMKHCDATPFLMQQVTPGVTRSIKPLRVSNVENSSEGSTNDSDDDDD
eukprot:CAMPEP_0116129646 /NCGR_PEP_ID=MMETSP0329-20121206/8030_1 /TAXON_ID=697910 /ORGANISM="Pseudo-nitzschia arenysensis, Strain B593" /LENGTH=732 /DNA_ID=CAMNT_0003623917 /DNA_START=42 /DNA_END=2237 /DNA_ORIENTATION=+